MSRRTFALYDTRLNPHGRPPSGFERVFTCNEQTPVNSIFRTISSYASDSNRINELAIMCHGFEDHIDPNLGMSFPQHRGGYGLVLGQENIFRSNVNVFASLRNKVDLIILMACAIADVRPEARRTIYDGRILCSEIAAHTGALVIASDTTQQFSTSTNTQISPFRGRWDNLLSLITETPHGEVNFGNWEGNVYKFHPNGQMEQM